MSEMLVGPISRSSATDVESDGCDRSAARSSCRCVLRDRSDAELMAFVEERQEAALTEVARRYGTSIRKVAHRFVAIGDVDDVAQDVLLYIWSHAGGFDPSRGGLQSYLALVTRCRALDHLRCRSVRQRSEDAQPNFDSIGDSSCSDPADQLARSLADDRLSHAMGHLPAAERAAIELTYIAGQTYRQAATTLGLPQWTVNRQIYSGLRHLREELKIDLEGRK